MTDSSEEQDNQAQVAGMSMLAALFGEANIEAAHAKGRAELEQAAERLRVAILAADPLSLLGYLWAQLLLGKLADAGGENPESDATSKDRSHDETIIVALEYVHAVLSGHAQNTGEAKEEAALSAVVHAAQQLREVILRYCLVAAAAMPGVMDEETRTLGMHSLTSWAMLRGHRY